MKAFDAVGAEIAHGEGAAFQFLRPDPALATGLGQTPRLTCQLLQAEPVGIVNDRHEETARAVDCETKVHVPMLQDVVIHQLRVQRGGARAACAPQRGAAGH